LLTRGVSREGDRCTTWIDCYLWKAVDVILPWRHGHLRAGKNAPGSRLGGIEVGDIWLGAQQWHIEIVRDEQVIMVGNASHDVSLAATDQVLDPLEGAWTILQQA